MAEVQSNFAGALTNLRDLRANLAAQLREVDTAIQSLERVAQLVGPGAMGTFTEIPPAPSTIDGLRAHPIHTSEADFSRISVRWAILWYLTEFSPAPERTGEITEALRRGGSPSKAEKFANFVSAVLSTMKAKGEVEVGEDGRFRISDAGRQTWMAIRQGNKFREATSPSAPPLLSEQ